MDQESKEIFSSSVTLRETPELDLQEDDVTQPLAVQLGGLTNEDLRELRPRKEGERQEEEEPTNRGVSAYWKWQRMFCWRRRCSCL